MKDEYQINISDVEEIDLDEIISNSDDSNDHDRSSEPTVESEGELYDQPDIDKYGNIIWRIEDGSE